MKVTSQKYDVYAAKSQLFTHPMGRLLRQQGFDPAPVDAKGFESVLSVLR